MINQPLLSGNSLPQFSAISALPTKVWILIVFSLFHFLTICVHVSAIVVYWMRGELGAAWLIFAVTTGSFLACSINYFVDKKVYLSIAACFGLSTLYEISTSTDEKEVSERVDGFGDFCIPLALFPSLFIFNSAIMVKDHDILFSGILSLKPFPDTSQGLLIISILGILLASLRLALYLILPRLGDRLRNYGNFVRLRKPSNSLIGCLIVFQLLDAQLRVMSLFFLSTLAPWMQGFLLGASLMFCTVCNLGFEAALKAFFVSPMYLLGIHPDRVTVQNDDSCRIVCGRRVIEFFVYGMLTTFGRADPDETSQYFHQFYIPGLVMLGLLVIYSALLTRIRANL